MTVRSPPLRDELRTSTLKQYDTAFGFSIVGDAGLDVSRQQSSEAHVFFEELDRADLLVDVGAHPLPLEHHAQALAQECPRKSARAPGVRRCNLNQRSPRARGNLRSPASSSFPSGSYG